MTSGSITTAAATASATAAPAQSLGITSAAAAPPMPRALDGWIVQIGAAPTENGANTLIDSAGQKVRSLAQFQGFVQRFDKDGQTYFRARFGGFSGQDAANDMCKQLKQAKLSCLAMQG